MDSPKMVLRRLETCVRTRCEARTKGPSALRRRGGGNLERFQVSSWRKEESQQSDTDLARFTRASQGIPGRGGRSSA